MSGCTHNCSTCSSDCGKAKEGIPFESMNEQSSCKKIYAVASGKGGVGKSSVCALLAAELNKKGYNVGVLDADITGPSAARAFGLSGTLASDGKNIIPKETESGIKVISTNLLLEDEE